MAEAIITRRGGGGKNPIKTWGNPTNVVESKNMTGTPISRLSVSGEGWVIAIADTGATTIQTYSLKIDGVFVHELSGLQASRSNLLLIRFNTSFEFFAVNNVIIVSYCLGSNYEESTFLIYNPGSSGTALNPTTSVSGKGWLYSLNFIDNTYYTIIVDGVTLSNNKIFYANLPTLIRFNTSFIIKSANASFPASLTYTLD